MRHRLGEALRRWANRLDPSGAPKYMGYSFTFETGAGIVFHDSYHAGCPVMYCNDADYQLAHTKGTA